MYCVGCGQNNLEQARFCQACGGALSPYAPPRAQGMAPAGAQVFRGYAGFWKRAGAYLVDLLLKTLISMVAGFCWGAVWGLTHPENPQTGAGVGGFFIGVLVSWLYDVIQESSEAQATFGKRALGIKVTDLEGRRISFGRANGRFFAKILSSITLMIGYAMAGFTEKKQGLHDMVAGTLVVND